MKKLFTLLFFALVGLNNINAATFSSVASGTWSAPATWNVTGVDVDGIPDSDDDVTINGGHTVTMTSSSYWQTLNIQSSAILNFNGQIMYGYGNYTNNGAVSGTVYYNIMAPTIFSSSSTFSNAGNWNIYGNLTISSGTTINKGNYFYLKNCTVNNFGNVKLYGGSLQFHTSTSTWVNEANSTLNVATSITGTGILIATSTGNTVSYSPGSQSLSIFPTTYYNLSLFGGFWKVASGDLTILNNFNLSGSYFNLNNFNMTVGGNWANNANYTIPNQGVITFDGSGTQTLYRATTNEQIENMVLNGSGTVLLNRSLFVNQSLTINSGTLDLNSSNIPLYLKGTLTNNGTLNCRQALVTFNGTSAQTISGSSNTQFYNLTLNNPVGLTINSPQSLTNALTNTGGTFNSNGNFTLISNSTNTARIAPVTGTGSFIGNMIIQKFISARAAGYHDLSSPVKNTTIMDWDDELYMSGIGADDGTPGPAGVDGSADGNSVYIYDEPTGNVAPNNGWTAVTGSGTSIESGKGYEIFLADDLNNFNAATLTSVGVPQFSTKTVNLSYTAGAGSYAGVNLIGNPYASAVTYSSCSKTNVTGNILLLDNSGNYNDYGANPIIPPHQGFWITASGSGASISFLENAKSTSIATSFYRTVPNYGIKLVFSSPSLPFYNENTINFESNSTLGYDRELDALYLKSPNKTAPAIYMLTNTDAKLITNNISTEEDEVTIPLAIFTPKEGVYYIEPTVLNTHSYNYSWIENTKTGKKFELNSSIAIVGEDNKTNTDYVLRLSKNSSESDVNQSVFDNDIIVFGTENDINLKSINTTHYISQVAIYDISGKLLMEQNNLTVESGQTNKIDISNLSSGVYIVNVTDVLGHIKTQKIIR